MKKIIPTVILAGLVILGALIAIRDLDPATRAARESRERAIAAQEWARAEEQQARAEAASTWAAAWAEGAPDRAAALTWAGIGLLGVTLTAAAGVAVAGIVYAHLRAQIAGRTIQPGRTGIYPAVLEPGGWTMLNEPRAQTLAALAAASPRRPTAAMVGRVLAEPMTPALPEPLPAPEIAAPAAHYPSRVEVYSAPLPDRLALPVGVDGSGRPVALPLRGLGSVVVGGLPNFGKSELLGSMAAGLLRQDPGGERSHLAVIDMKLVSFGNLPADLAGLRWPVATDIDEAHEIIAAVRAECQRRFELLRGAGARTLEEYEQRTGERLPYVTVLVDEIADLTCDDDRNRAQRFVSSALDVARKGRAAGLGLVLATQRPSVDVLPSSLRNLAGAAVAFRVSRNHDSAAILGEPGAEQLPAIPGRCLVKRAEIVQCQAYACGLEGGRFDAFVASLPRGGIATPASWWTPTTTTGGQPVGASTIPTTPEWPLATGGQPVERIERGRAPTPEQAARMRQLYASGWSLNRLCDRFYGYKDSTVLAFVRDAVGYVETRP